MGKPDGRSALFLEMDAKFRAIQNNQERIIKLLEGGDEKPEPCILRGVEPAEEKRPCIGYGDAWADEPCEMCKGCSQCTGNDEEAEG